MPDVATQNPQSQTHRDKPTREQQRAAAAYKRVKTRDKKYGRQCLRLPALIHQCGLCQALAFLEAKELHEVLDDLAWVIWASDDEENRPKGPALADKARGTGMAEYQWLSREALKSAQWLKRYSEAVLKVKPGEDTAGESQS